MNKSQRDKSTLYTNNITMIIKSIYIFHIKYLVSQTISSPCGIQVGDPINHQPIGIDKTGKPCSNSKA